MVNVRNLQKKDAGRVALLIPQLTKNIIEPDNLIKRIEKLANQKNSQFLVAELQNKVVGFGGLVWYVIPSKGLIGWAEELVVDGQYRRQGIGRALMERLLVLAQQKKVTVVKLTSTPTAKSLYETLGFTKKDQDYLVKSLTFFNR